MSAVKVLDDIAMSHQRRQVELEADRLAHQAWVSLPTRQQRLLFEGDFEMFADAFRLGYVTARDQR